MGVGRSTLSATFSATCLEALMKHSSMCSTTLRISSTRLLSCLHAGPAPKQNLKAKRMFCWLRMGWQFSVRLEQIFWHDECAMHQFSIYLVTPRIYDALYP